MTDERSLEERLTEALDAAGDGSSSPSRLRRHSPDEPGRDIDELLETAGYLRESLVEVPAPAGFRRELGDWLAQPRPGPWWSGRRRVGAAIGLGAAAAIAVGVVAWRRRGAVLSSTGS